MTAQCTQHVESLAGERANAIADGRVVAQHATDEDGARAEHHHRRQDQLDRAADLFGTHEASSAVLKTVVNRPQHTTPSLAARVSTRGEGRYQVTGRTTTPAATAIGNRARPPGAKKVRALNIWAPVRYVSRVQSRPRRARYTVRLPPAGATPGQFMARRLRAPGRRYLSRTAPG